jgi:RimJ/RimL family protein N-acetyltransferase
MKKTVVFLKGCPGWTERPQPLIPCYESMFWRPSLTKIRPPTLGLFPALIWWLFHLLRIFRNREYGVLLIRHGETWVHRSAVMPGYFRFPFMKPDDLQVGDVWTAESERNKGLARWALSAILSADSNRNRCYWYLTEASNRASIRVAERACFRPAAEGIRTTRCGIQLLGTFQIQRELDDRR